MTEQASIAKRIRGLFTHAPHIRSINAVVIVIASVLSILLLQTVERATEVSAIFREVTNEHLACSESVSSLKQASDDLTSSARLFTVTHDIEFVEKYYEEVNVTKRRDAALDVLRFYLEDGQASQLLEVALEESNALAEQEGHAMRLVAEAQDYPISGSLEPLASYPLSASELELEPDEQLALAQELLFGKEYRARKASIDGNVDACTSQLLLSINEHQNESAQLLQVLLTRERMLTVALLTMVVLTIFLVIYLILWPIASYSSLIADGMPLIAAGSQELRDLAHEYNALYEENRQRADHLRHKADHDPLTGLFNRGAYDDFAATYTEHVALMLVDVDYFKTVNDTYGHEVGDQILKKVARHLDHAFRASDFPCRIGGDEFAVVITDMSPQLKHVVTRKIGQVAQGMLDTSDGLPAITLSIGVAFSEQLAADDTIFKAADRALYLVKERGRNGYAFSDEVS